MHTHEVYAAITSKGDDRNKNEGNIARKSHNCEDSFPEIPKEAEMKNKQ